MIPILFASTETAFTTQGLGRLLDARKCLVTEERNGEYELTMQYPTAGALFDKLVPGNYIAATHDENGDIQPFQIYHTSAPLDGWVTVNAWHISYQLNRVVVQPFTASTCSAALSGIATNSMNTNPFTFTTDKTTSASFGLTKPTNARAVLGGTSGSILDTFGGGEYEFNMFNVKLWASRGTNSGVTIRYGKNLRKLDYELDASNVYNAVVPFWQNNENTVYVDHPVVKTGQTANGVIALDLSREFTETPTVAELETKAQSYIDASTNYVLKDNIKVDFVPLWQTEEFKNYEGIAKVKLCDTVNVYYEKFGINATAKVISVTFDVLLERYTSIELGEPQTSLAQQIAQDVVSKVLPEVPVIIRRTIITTEGTYPSGWQGSTKIENGTYESHASIPGAFTDGKMNAEGFEFVSVDESDGYYEKLTGFVDAPDGITQVRLENADGDATTIQTTGINTTGDLKVGGDITGKIGGATHQTTLINSGSSKTFTVPSGSRHLILVSGTVTARMAAYLIGCATNGTVGTGALLTGSSITMTTATNAITIGTSGGSASILIITFSGSPITFS